MPRKIDEIIIHCTATRPDFMADSSSVKRVDKIRQWHLDRQWSDLGYHWLVDRSGEVVEGRPVERAGAHVKGHNANSIGIALFGGFGGLSGDDFADNFTEDQDKALRGLIGQLRQQFPEINKISGHNQYASKACPTFSVPSWLQKSGAVSTRPLVRAKVRTSPTQSSTVRASVVAATAAVGSCATAIGSLDRVAQCIVLGFAGLGVLMAIWIIRERLRKWAEGDR